MRRSTGNHAWNLAIQSDRRFHVKRGLRFIIAGVGWGKKPIGRDWFVVGALMCY